jgi:hypothetical protein
LSVPNPSRPLMSGCPAALVPKADSSTCPQIAFPHARFVAVGTLWLTIIVCTMGAGAYGNDKIDWVAEGAESLARTARFPWYDRNRDEVRPIHPLPSRDLSGNRHSTWEDAAQTSSQTWNFSRAVQITNSILSALAWFTLALFAGLLAFALGWAFLKREASQAQPTSRRRFAVEDVAFQIEQLPFALDAKQLDFLAEARRCFEAGDYQRAAVYLFSYQLVYLDQHQLIRLERGRTNRQYLSQLRHNPQLQTLFEPTMVLFEEVFFGGSWKPHGNASMPFISSWSRIPHEPAAN